MCCSYYLLRQVWGNNKFDVIQLMVRSLLLKNRVAAVRNKLTVSAVSRPHGGGAQRAIREGGRRGGMRLGN